MNTFNKKELAKLKSRGFEFKKPTTKRVEAFRKSIAGGEGFVAGVFVSKISPGVAARISVDYINRLRKNTDLDKIKSLLSELGSYGFKLVFEEKFGVSYIRLVNSK